jgi:hypothetical protein
MAISQIKYYRLSPVCGIDLDDAMKGGGGGTGKRMRVEVK